ncbi:MAG TPA: hypothetical protein VMX75_06920 [Spirochaetia bacterium]|nr:hypothetical protein [Spirochaetia bacterium]
MNKKEILLCLFLLLTAFTAAQEAGQVPAAGSDKLEGQKPAGIAIGFRGINLGMDLEAVKDLLLKDPFFDYRGDPDVSFLPRTYDSLIECRGNAYIKRAFFQFKEKRLSIMILVLDPDKIDHYSVFARLNERYGVFTSLSPEKVVWEDEKVILTLERPLSVKYIDRKVFEDELKAGVAGENLRDTSRLRFLDNF